MYLNVCWRKRGHKMYVNVCWPNPFHDPEDIKSISTCVDETYPMPARTQNASQNVMTKSMPCKRAHQIYITTCVKVTSCQQGHKIYLNLCSTYISHAWEDTKYISTCVEQTPPMPARNQNVTQDVFTKPLPLSQLVWTIISHAWEDIKYISTCVEETYQMRSNPSHVSKDTKYI
jgi:hypothetical protein